MNRFEHSYEYILKAISDIKQILEEDRAQIIECRQSSNDLRIQRVCRYKEDRMTSIINRLYQAGYELDSDFDDTSRLRFLKIITGENPDISQPDNRTEEEKRMDMERLFNLGDSTKDQDSYL